MDVTLLHPAPIDPRITHPMLSGFEFLLTQLAPLLLSGKPAVFLNQISERDWKYLQSLDPLAALLAPIVYHQFRSRGNHQPALIYRPERLQNSAAGRGVGSFLKDFGYQPDWDLRSMLAHWQMRLESDFPHETGIFLGIPLEDVRGFIQYHGKYYLLNRYWKVYHQPDCALRIFSAYDSAKKEMAQIIAKINAI